MSYPLNMIEKPTYQQRESEARQCFNVLIEENLVGRRLETGDAYQIAAEGSAKARGIFHSVAYADVNAGGDLMRFAKTVGNNRGLPMSVFATVAEAEKWLTGKSR